MLSPMKLPAEGLLGAWCSCITSSTDLTRYGRISSVQVFGQDQAGPNPSPANLLKLHCSRRAVPGEMLSGCSDLQPFRGMSPRLFDGSLAAPGCWGSEAPFNYLTPGRKVWVPVKLNGTAEQARWCCCRLQGSWELQDQKQKYSRFGAGWNLALLLQVVFGNKAVLCCTSHFYLHCSY